MPNQENKAEFTPEVREAFDTRVGQVIQEAHKMGQHKICYGIAVTMLALFDLPDDVAREMLVFAGMCTSTEIKQHLNGMGHFLNVAGYSNDELRATEAQYQETLRELKEGVENHGKTH